MEKKNYLKPNLREVKMKQRMRIMSGSDCNCHNFQGGHGASRSFNLDEDY